MAKPRERSAEEVMDAHRIMRRGSYFERKKLTETEPCPPYTIAVVDQFHSQSEDGYKNISESSTYKEAVRAADEITKNSRGSGPIEKWLGWSDAGLVYDAEGALVWDGVLEYVMIDEQQRFSQAVEFATKAHLGQLRKGTNIPYIKHPLGVAETLRVNNCSHVAIVAAVLHDVLEDTSVTYEELKDNFGAKIADVVKAVTEPDRQASWLERKRHKIEYLKNAPWNVLLVACADKLYNIRSIKEDYQKQGETLWERFNAGKDSQEWYYKSLSLVFAPYAEDSLFQDLFKEFILEVDAVFSKE